MSTIFIKFTALYKSVHNNNYKISFNFKIYLQNIQFNKFKIVDLVVGHLV